MCWGLPVVHMVLHYIVQGHRFDIVEDFGCRASTYSSVQALLLVWTLPLLASVPTIIFAALALVHFFRRRVSFSRHLQDSSSALTPSRYFRLMAMAILQMFWGVLLISINIWFTCKSGLRPWTSWADVHYNFSRVGLFPTIIIPVHILRWTTFLWWTIPISSFLFFAFFSFGEEAMKEYRACWRTLKGIFVRKSEPPFEGNRFIFTLDVAHQNNLLKRNEVSTTDFELKTQRVAYGTDASSVASSYSDCLPSLGSHAV